MADILLKVTCVTQTDGSVTQTDYFYDDVAKSTHNIVTTDVPSTECQVYSRSTTEKIDEYCRDYDLVKVYHDGNGKVNKKITYNSGTCGFVCSLEITDLRVTDETVLGAEDGTVEIIVSTNASGSVRYSLDNFSTSQTSKKYTGLRPGSYVAYARSADGECSDSMPFSIAPGPSPGPRWLLEYDTESGAGAEIKIYKEGYNGETEKLKGAGTPLTLDIKGKGDDIYAPIKPTEAIINFIAFQDFQFNEIFQADERDYRVEVYENGLLIFMGYLLPDVYQEPYLYPPFEVSVSATDGLSVLDNFPLTSNAGTEIIEEKPAIELIATILNKLGLRLPIVSHVNLFESQMTTGLGEDPLAQVKLPPQAFIEEGEFVDSYEALARILTAFNARIYQEKGKWHIVRINQAADAGRAVREFDSNGVLVSSYTTGDVKEIGRPNIDPLFWVEVSQLLQYRPAMKKVTTDFNFGGRRNYIPNGHFEAEDWNTDGTLKGWTGGASYSKRNSEFKPDGDFRTPEFDLYLVGKVSAISSATKIKCRQFWMRGKRMGFRIHFNIQTLQAVDYTKQNPQLYVEIRRGDSYYNLDDARWESVQTVNNVITTAQFLKFGEYDRADYRIVAPPEAGLCEVTIYQCVSPDYTIDGVLIPGITIYDEYDVLFIGDINNTKANARNFTEENKQEIHLGDKNITQDRAYARTMYVGNEPTVSWEGEAMHVRHSIDRFANYQSARQLLTGTLKGALNFSDALYDKLNPNKYFMCTGFTLDHKMGTREGEWHEITTINTPPSNYLIDYEGDYLRDYENDRLLNY